MRILLIIGLLTLNSSSLMAQSESSTRLFEMESDGEMITMKKYFLCIYEKGDNRNQDKAIADSIQSAHLEHIGSMAKSGFVKVAGPFETDENSFLRGILIFDVDNLEKAEELVGKDPAVISGRLNFKVLPWWTKKDVCLD